MRILKWAGIGLGSILLLVAAAAAAFVWQGHRKLGRTYEVTAAAVAVPAGREAEALGEHVMRIHGCQDCHGENLAGGVFMDAPPAMVVAPNLTAGRGGVGRFYTDADWDRAIRYGVRPDESWLLPMMPYGVYHHIGDEDTGALIAYLKSLPPVDNELPKTRVRPLGYLMIGATPFEEDVATAADREPMPPRGPTAEYGAYLAASSCVECHDEDLRGGEHPAPGAQPAPDLAGAGVWPFEVFARVMREGVRPDGTKVTGFMPWPAFSAMTDDELKALQLNLKRILEEQAAASSPPS